MLRMTRPSATMAAAAENPVATVGRYLVRYTLVVVIAWIGALKYGSYEATAIQPLIAHSPIFSWLYNIFSVSTFAAVLGSLEIVAALLIAVRPLFPPAVGHRQRDGHTAVPEHADLPVHHARSHRGVRIPRTVGAARAVPAQGPSAGQCLAMDAGRLAECRSAAARST